MRSLPFAASCRPTSPSQFRSLMTTGASRPGDTAAARRCRAEPRTNRCLGCSPISIRCSRTYTATGHPAASDPVLAALAKLAPSNDLAARALLQAMLPGLKAPTYSFCR